MSTKHDPLTRSAVRCLRP